MKSLIILLVVAFAHIPVSGQNTWETISDSICSNDCSAFSSLVLTKTNKICVCLKVVFKGPGTMYTSVDAGLKWQETENFSWVKSAPNGYLFARIDGPDGYWKLHISADDGNTFRLSRLNDQCNHDDNLAFQKLRDDTIKVLIGAEKGLYYSIDNGENFTIMKSPYSRRSEGIGVNSNGDIFCLYSNDSTYSLFKTSDNGNNWENILTERKYLRLFISSNDNIFVISNSITDGIPNKIILSKDNGESWITIFSVENDKENSSVILKMIENSAQEIFILSGKNIIGTNDEGMTWKSIGLDTLSITNLAIDSEDFLYALVSGNCPDDNNWKLYKTVNQITSIENSELMQQKYPYGYSLSQNYPNPFNPSTKIAFSLPKSEYVELKVYNILGKEVSTLVSNKLNQGNHTYQFNGKNLASGIYYYQLVAGDYREVKKMILLR